MRLISIQKLQIFDNCFTSFPLIPVIHKRTIPDNRPVYQKIRLQIENADSRQSKADLNEVREMLYDLQHKIHPLYQMISQQIQQMHSKREHIENSFFGNKRPVKRNQFPI
mgnify:CR=1 FL=1